MADQLNGDRQIEVQPRSVGCLDRSTPGNRKCQAGSVAEGKAQVVGASVKISSSSCLLTIEINDEFYERLDHFFG